MEERKRMNEKMSWDLYKSFFFPYFFLDLKEECKLSYISILTWEQILSCYPKEEGLDLIWAFFSLGTG